MIQFLKVRAPHPTTRLRDPLVLAYDGDTAVRYTRRDGWTSKCLTCAGACQHIAAVAALVDPRILGDGEGRSEVRGQARHDPGVSKAHPGPRRCNVSEVEG